MTNFEHYKDEIEKAVNDESLFLFLKQRGRGCIAYYPAEITKWYLAEYIEPYKLTKLEKIILENINPKLIYVVKEESNDVCIVGANKWNGIHITYPFLNAKFDCLKIGEYYKIADILDNCEVIDEMG